MILAQKKNSLLFLVVPQLLKIEAQIDVWWYLVIVGPRFAELQDRNNLFPNHRARSLDVIVGEVG